MVQLCAFLAAIVMKPPMSVTLLTTAKRDLPGAPGSRSACSAPLKTTTGTGAARPPLSIASGTAPHWLDAGLVPAPFDAVSRR